MLKKNDQIPLTIEGIMSDGNGIGHWEGMVVFVPGTAPWDEITALIVKVHPRYCYAIIKELASPSPQRIPMDCPAGARCGGCSLRHISYEEECRCKAGWVQDCFVRLGKIDAPMEEILPSPQRDRYRNKAQYPFALVDGRPRAGFFARRSHRIIPCGRDCLLQPEIFGQIVAAVEDFLAEKKISIYDEASHRGLVRHLFLRQAEYTGQIMVCLVINGRRLPCGEEFAARLREQFPAVSSILLNVNTQRTNVILGQECIPLWGEAAVTDALLGVHLRISPLAFYQVNRRAAEQLYAAARQYAALTKEDVLLDLYCGTGSIGLTMARDVKKLYGVEIIPQAVENARENARLNGLDNAEFFCCDASDTGSFLNEKGIRPTVVVLDPPRKGCGPDVVELVAGLAPRRVVMISCNPATAARDCALFARQGYRVERYRPVDLFPRTAHVETVVLLQRETL